MHRLDRASAELGVDLWIKRDDLTGFAMGGNKGRKLEYLIADALDKGADTVVTCGSVQSNFIRQLGAACAVVGMRCVAVVMELPYEYSKPMGILLNSRIGNPQLNILFGVETVLVSDDNWDVLFRECDVISKKLSDAGGKVYSIPIGGSSPLGAYAFYVAAQEVIATEIAFDWVVTSSSSGSTQTGLTYGFHGTPTQVLGISADPEPEFLNDLQKLGYSLAELLGELPVAGESFVLNQDFVGYGYGVTDDETLAAIRWLATREGILLDPIYSGKAFRGLLELVRNHTLKGRILFWHTGGQPTLWALGH